MSSHLEPKIGTFKANADLSASQYCFVKLTDAKTVDLQGTKGGKTIGILMNAPLSGDMAEVALPGGGAKLKVGGNVALMDKMIANTTTGQGIADDAAGQWVGAQAHDTGVANDVIPVMVTAFESEA